MTAVFAPNRAALQQLRDLGLPDNGAIRGLLHTGNQDANRAAEWCFEHLDDPNFDLPLTNDELQVAQNAEPMNAPYELEGADVPAAKLVFVVNAALKMGAGTIASQVSRATIDICRTLQQFGHGLFEAWLSSGGKTVVLKGKDDEQLKTLLEKARSANLATTELHDAEVTPAAPDSLTVFGLFGEVLQVDAVTGELSLL